MQFDFQVRRLIKEVYRRIEGPESIFEAWCSVQQVRDLQNVCHVHWLELFDGFHVLCNKTRHLAIFLNRCGTPRVVADMTAVEEDLASPVVDDEETAKITLFKRNGIKNYPFQECRICNHLKEWWMSWNSISTCHVILNLIEILFIVFFFAIHPNYPIQSVCGKACRKTNWLKS